MDAANERMAGMTEAEWNDAKALEAAILEQLVQAKATGDPTGEAARELCAMHARWLQMHWGEGTYSPAAHAVLAEGYVARSAFHGLLRRLGRRRRDGLPARRTCGLVRRAITL